MKRKLSERLEKMVKKRVKRVLSHHCKKQDLGFFEVEEKWLSDGFFNIFFFF